MRNYKRPTRLDDAAREDVKKLWREGKSYEYISRKYDICDSTVYNICKDMAQEYANATNKHKPRSSYGSDIQRTHENDPVDVLEYTKKLLQDCKTKESCVAMFKSLLHCFGLTMDWFGDIDLAQLVSTFGMQIEIFTRKGE